MKKWRQKKRVVIGYFECSRCKTRFRRAIESINAYEEFIENNLTVKEWLELKSENTRRQYGIQLQKFCELTNITPEQFQKLPNKEARDVAWSYVKTLLKDKKPGLASIAMYALKSFYRNHDGEILSFDSKRGGKHYLNNLRRKRVVYEHVPNRKEVYRIANIATNLRDRAIVLMLFQSGIRVNALCRLNYGHVKNQLLRGKIPIRLRITDEIDTKLRGYSIAFYDTFIGKEAIEALEKYCQSIQYSGDNKPLFQTESGRRMNPVLVWSNIKKCIIRAGFDKKSITVHTFRKAFKRVVRQADIDEELKEAIMGHVLPGSRENYFSREDVEEVKKAYMKIDFSEERTGVEYENLNEKFRKIETERNVLENVVKEQRGEIQQLKESYEKTEGVGKYIDRLYERMNKMAKEIEELKKQR